MGKSKFKHFFCAFCRTPRKIKKQKHIGLFEIGLSLLGSLCLMIFFYQSFDFKFFPIFCIFLILSEVIVHIGRRLSMACPHCGFDPIIYRISPEKAASSVKDYLDKKKQDPLVLFSKTASLNLPKKPKIVPVTNQSPKKIVKNKPAHIAKNLDIQL